MSVDSSPERPFTHASGASGLQTGAGHPDWIEEAAFEAWPCLDEEHVGGWRLRFAGGFTKRANSANAGVQARVLQEAEIAEVEARYRVRGLRPVFRLTGQAVGEAMDPLLASRGYHLTDPSLVMTLSLSAETFRPGLREGLHRLDAGNWLRAFRGVSAKPGDQAGGEQGDVHLQLLSAMPASSAYAVLPDAGEPVACGIAVRSGRYIGLFEIATRPDRRGEGFATALCSGLLSWGGASGADTAYLQVDGRNLGAIRLYERLGFLQHYTYWYRVAA